MTAVQSKSSNLSLIIATYCRSPKFWRLLKILKLIQCRLNLRTVMGCTLSQNACICNCTQNAFKFLYTPILCIMLVYDISILQLRPLL